MLFVFESIGTLELQDHKFTGEKGVKTVLFGKKDIFQLRAEPKANMHVSIKILCVFVGMCVWFFPTPSKVLPRTKGAPGKVRMNDE